MINIKALSNSKNITRHVLETNRKKSYLADYLFENVHLVVYNVVKKVAERHKHFTGTCHEHHLRK